MPDKMTQIKFTIESNIVSAFKSKCAFEGVSMTSAARRFMETCQFTRETRIETINRTQRKRIVLKIISLLTDILYKESQYRDAIPEQFTTRYETADHACECLSEAITYLEEVFP
jgi:hypothetical protein